MEKKDLAIGRGDEAGTGKKTREQSASTDIKLENAKKSSGAEANIDKVTGEFICKSSVYRSKIGTTKYDEFPTEGNGIGEDVIGRSVTHPNYQDLGLDVATKGWTFDDDQYPNKATDDKTLREVYLRSNINYTGNWIVPCLFDTKTERVVNNESSDIMAILNDNFNEFATNKINLRPRHLMTEIERLADWLYPINNGVYQCGFARSQKAYDKAAQAMMKRLDGCEKLLYERTYIAGDVFSEADLRLFSTLVRWDSIYFVHFKCCFRRIQCYPKLSQYVRQIYAREEIRKDIPFDYIRRHYFQDHRTCNPHGIVPLGPFVMENLSSPHDRGEIDFAAMIDD